MEQKVKQLDTSGRVDKNHKSILLPLGQWEALHLISGVNGTPSDAVTLSLCCWHLLREGQAHSCSEEDHPVSQETLGLLQPLCAPTIARKVRLQGLPSS